MKHRKLRIAWSVVWGLVALLLVVLWARSYWKSDEIAGCVSNTGVIILADAGSVQWVYIYDPHLASTPQGWRYSNQATEDDTRFLSVILGKFRIRRDPPMTTVLIPDWALIISVVTLPVAPWMPSRFSLRTLLIATTLVAVVLGLIAWATNK